MDYVINSVVTAFNPYKPQYTETIDHDKLKLKAYAMIAVYTRDASLVDDSM